MHPRRSLWKWKGKGEMSAPSALSLAHSKCTENPNRYCSSGGYYVDLSHSSLKIWSRRRAGVFFSSTRPFTSWSSFWFGDIQDHGLLTALKWHPWACPWNSVHFHCSFLRENPQVLEGLAQKCLDLFISFLS